MDPRHTTNDAHPNQDARRDHVEDRVRKDTLPPTNADGDLSEGRRSVEFDHRNPVTQQREQASMPVIGERGGDQQPLEHPRTEGGAGGFFGIAGGLLLPAIILFVLFLIAIFWFMR